MIKKHWKVLGFLLLSFKYGVCSYENIDEWVKYYNESNTKKIWFLCRNLMISSLVELLHEKIE